MNVAAAVQAFVAAVVFVAIVAAGAARLVVADVDGAPGVVVVVAVAVGVGVGVAVDAGLVLVVAGAERIAAGAAWFFVSYVLSIE